MSASSVTDRNVVNQEQETSDAILNRHTRQGPASLERVKRALLPNHFPGGALRGIPSLVLLLALNLTSRLALAESLNTELFERQIRPALIEHCYECHSASSKRLKGGLRLDSREGMLNGGDSGPAIKLDAPSSSLLLKALNQNQIEMPPKGKLSQSMIQAFAAWLDQGAPVPSSFDREGNQSAGDKLDKDALWSLESIQRPKLPSIQKKDWVRNPIDHFILHQLETQGLEPSVPAATHTLMRRLHFDITGLPPRATDFERGSESALNFVVLVDELFARPQFGEFWGRKWLDLARYADTNGFDENYNYLRAWRYRDYVVRSLNQDKAYDQFLMEQIAGDLLAPSPSLSIQRDRITATGFLTLGPKMLAEQDKDKLLIDIVDEQIDIVSKTTMGLTIACARCHDHKFDPISTKDYYALAGIFRSTKTMANTDHVSYWTETILPDPENEKIKAEHQRELEDLAAQIKTLEASDRSEDKTKELKRTKSQLKELTKRGPRYQRAMAVIDGDATDLRVHIRGNHLNLAKTKTARGFPKQISERMASAETPRTGSGRLELGRWLTASDHPLTARVIVNRIWQGYFGIGLVATPSNFGLRGEKPSHPQLLDWLASELLESRWSLKHIHRLIVTSATYQQSSRHHQRSADIDPDNRFYWRQNQRRLSAESIRDAILFVSDRLNPMIGGVVEKADRNETYYRGSGAEFASTRRALYLPVIRGRGYEMFNTFDYSDSGAHLSQRTTTTVPHQALFMLNAPLVGDSAEALAKTIGSSQFPLAAAPVETLYQHLFFRRPTPTESRQASEFFDTLESQTEAPSERSPLGILIQSLIAANEFIYVD